VQRAGTDAPKEIEAILDIRSVGFFHFASDFDGNPIESLEEALDQVLKKEQDARPDQIDAPKPFRDSLLVVPEAFNLRFGYLDRALRIIGSEIRDRLIDLSRRRGMALVVGLLDDHGGRRPYNSAYLIDGGEAQMLSRKHNSDQSDNYATCNLPDNCYDNVIPHRGLRIAALVCMDADQYPGQETRHKNILEQLDGPGRKVLCVPSCFSRPPQEVVAHWPDLITVVLANRGQTHPSIVRLEKCVAMESPDCKKDHIQFWDLPEV
jgi:predicted amidohydrolase